MLGKVRCIQIKRTPAEQGLLAASTFPAAVQTFNGQAIQGMTGSAGDLNSLSRCGDDHKGTPGLKVCCIYGVQKHIFKSNCTERGRSGIIILTPDQPCNDLKALPDIFR